MRRLWLIVALGVSLAGCFDTHGPDDDAGIVDPPPFDGGGAECRTASEGGVLELRCPATAPAWGTARIEIDTAPPWCCSSGAARASEVRETSRGYSAVDLAWTACDCCDGCRCVGPIETVVVEVPVVVPGTNGFEVNGARCNFAGVEPAACRLADVTDFRFPRHLIEGQSLSATLTAIDGTSCSCTPRIAPTSEGYALALEVCDCCDECDCIDPGYQSSVVHPPPAIGSYTVSIPHGVMDLGVHARSECYELPAATVEVVGPDDGLIVTGPRLTWARVTGEAWVCCATPAPAVEETQLPDGTIELRLLSCELDPCACDPAAPTPVEAWHSLGELAPGTYTLQAGTVTTTFVVP